MVNILYVNRDIYCKKYMRVPQRGVSFNYVRCGMARYHALIELGPI